MNSSRKERIDLLLKQQLPGVIFVVENFSHEHSGHDHAAAESHFRIRLQKDSLQETNRILVHRQIHKILESEWQSGLHALSIEME